MSKPAITELTIPFASKTGWPWTEASPMLPEVMSDGSPWPKISIVTPSYNQAQYLEETIRSVLLQGYPNLEYIIIDGGSSDDSVEIIKKYEPWLAYWVTEKDRGQSHAINKGWQQATGELLAWLNSDDFYEPSVLKQVAFHYKKCRKDCSGFIFAKAKVVNLNGEFISMRGEPFNLTECLLENKNPIQQPSVFIPKRVLDDVGLLDEDLHYSMDGDLFIRISTKYQPVFIPEIWSNVRYTPDTKTSRNPSGFPVDKIQTLRKLYSSREFKKQYKYIQSRAFAKTYIGCAYTFFKSHLYKKAIGSILAAFFWDPFFLVKRFLHRILFLFMKESG